MICPACGNKMEFVGTEKVDWWKDEVSDYVCFRCCSFAFVPKKENYFFFDKFSSKNKLKKLPKDKFMQNEDEKMSEDVKELLEYLKMRFTVQKINENNEETSN